MSTRFLLDQVAKVMHTGESVLVALSGGADSVALLAALVELGYRCVAFHCNYGLRGDESKRDERHAVDVASQLCVPIEVINCNVSDYRKKHPGISVEMACREMRYTAFNEALKRHQLDSIAVGHHLEDNIETLMLNLLRGSGIKGLAAMKPRREKIVRPLINCTKEQILEYLASREINYITDSSNLSCDYRRNALRNEILPLIKKYFPECDSGFVKTLSALDSQRTLLDATIADARKKYINAQGIISLQSILEDSSSSRELLFEILNYPDYQGFNPTVIENILSSHDKSGLVFSGNDTKYILDHGKLIPYENTEDIPAPQLNVEIITPAEFRPTRDPNVAYFDCDRLRGCKQIILRHPEIGDRLQPWGMKGSRLLSDIFSDLHYSIPERQRAWILEADGMILWLIGIRASRHFPVTSETKSILRLSLGK